MVKDILVIRLSKQNKGICTEAYDEIVFRLNEKFDGIYTVVVIEDENDTNKTEFEIIKYNG